MADNNEQADDIPPNFHHPYQPYDVQLQFMRTVYDVLEKGNSQVGILESPTGTVCPFRSPPGSRLFPRIYQPSPLSQATLLM